MPNLFKIRNSKFEIRNWQVNKGFTLIELLVVIAIIGILATFIVASFASAQQRGRDARRKADLDAVKKALELAKNDCTGSKWYPQVSAAGEAGYDALETYLDYPALNYIRQVPVDPSRQTPDDYQYTTSGPSALNVCLNDNVGTTRIRGGAQRFLLRARLENVNDPSSSESITKCASSGAVAVANQAPYYVCEY